MKVEPGIRIKHFRQPMGVTVFFGQNVAISGKTVVFKSPGKDNGNGIYKVEVYAFAMCFGETWTEDKKVTANDG